MAVVLGGSYERRHWRWYERMVFNSVAEVLVGLVVVLVVPALIFWGGAFWASMDAVRESTSWMVAGAFAAAVWVLHRLGRLSGGAIWTHVGPVVTGTFLLGFAVLLFTRSSYSRPVLLSSYVLALLWCYGGYFVGRRYRLKKFAVLPMQGCAALQSSRAVEFRVLQTPDLQGVRYDGVVADLQNLQTRPEWERFIAQCLLARLPVFNLRQATEGLTGRVRIDQLSENAVGSLMPSPLYAIWKRVADVAAVLVSLPVSVPLMGLTAVAVWLDSPGPALFVQQRVGLGNRDFQMYKFRSMRVGTPVHGAGRAASDDARTTRVGRFIRKTRLDELPQLWNVLKGDMSLIGPRAEWRTLARQYEAEIPFYIYRHVVRPGVTGWAQVMQGYAADADATRIKIQHDFYYIKYFSLWLDLLIAFKTVRILLTGWGAR